MKKTAIGVCLFLGLICTDCPLVISRAWADRAPENHLFQVGFARRDITPPAGLPMWGYGHRGDSPAEGALDRMFATALVIRAGNDKLAVVGLDLGRGPTSPMMQKIRRATDEAKIGHVMIAGSHTHHGPVLEIIRVEGLPPQYVPAIDYNEKLPDLIIEAILEADRSVRPARMGIASKSVALNRNRHTKREPQPVEPMLAVMRFDDEAGHPIAVLVNYAAHPTITDNKLMKWSADYPGFMKTKVESALKTNCIFMQGAAGDMSVSRKEGGARKYGEDLADVVVELAGSVKTVVPKNPSIKAKVDSFTFRARPRPERTAGSKTDKAAELRRRFSTHPANEVPAELNTVLLNGEIALVGGSGEFFCNHSNRLKERSYVPRTLFFGYCNGHSFYFPTIEAASEGGYGADPLVGRAEIGAGEQMIDQALINIYTMLGKFRESDLPLASQKHQPVTGSAK